MKTEHTDGVEAEFRIVIPARYGSSRFPGKPLATIAGQPMIAHTWNCAANTGAADVIVATDDQRILDFCESEGMKVMLTSTDHPTGTDRVAEVVDAQSWPDETIVVCLQGDEPATPPVIVRQVARNLALNPSASIATLCAKIHTIDEYENPNRVKVVFDKQGFALYFSRAPVPYRRDGETNRDSFPEAWVHIGMYAYRAAFLRTYKTLEPHQYENEEKLEQLRALGNGYRIHVDQAEDVPAHGVDQPEDIALLEKILGA